MGKECMFVCIPVLSSKWEGFVIRQVNISEKASWMDGWMIPNDYWEKYVF